MLPWKNTVLPELPGTAPQLKLWDSSRQELVEPEVAGGASLYVCGITPYDATHMGHASTYVAFDLLLRQWADTGITPQYVQNVTDVDDPLLERASATGVDWRDLAAEQIELFHGDMVALNVIAPDHYVGAVESVPWIVDGVEHLLAEGMAYRVAGQDGEPDGDVYFDSIAAQGRTPADGFDAWFLGQVSGYDEATMVKLSAERGGDPKRPGKRHALDPLLWRVEREGEPSWEGRSLGAGRPGWHIECSLIARKFLPAPFTVQAGGSDLRFPHHEFSAAHAYAADGTPLARHYAHAGMVGLDGEKMSKSLGNLVLVSKLRKSGVDPMAVRLVLLSQHYRSDWFWTDGLLEEAQQRLDAWRSAVKLPWSVEEANDLLDSIRTAMAQDLNAPEALAAVDAAVDQVASRALDNPELNEELKDTKPALLVAAAVNGLLGVKL